MCALISEQGAPVNLIGHAGQGRRLSELKLFIYGYMASGVIPAASQRSGQFNRKRNSSMTNVDLSAEPDRIKQFFLFYLLKKQSEATSTIRQSSIDICHSL